MNSQQATGNRQQARECWRFVSAGALRLAPRALRLLPVACCLLPSVPGCQFFLDRRQATPPVLKLAAPPPVRAEDITTANAAEKVRQLSDELDRESEGDEGK